MVSLVDPKWGVLRHFIDKGDKLGLTMVNPDYFTGLARTVYSVALEESVISMPVMQQALLSALDDISYDHAMRDLSQSIIAEEDVDQYIRALSISHNNWRIKDAVDWAGEKINEGHNRLHVAEELVTRLSTIHEGRKDKSFEDVFASFEDLRTPSIPTGMPAFIDVGVDRWFMGNLMLLAGDTGTFKTTTAVNICMAALRADPELHVYYFMKEQPFHEVWYKIITQCVPFSYRAVQSKMNADHADWRVAMRATISDADLAVMQRFHVVDQNEFSRPIDIAGQLKGYSKRHAKIMWVLDYATRLDYGGRPEHFNAYYAAGLETLKNATLSTQSFGIIITQLKDGWNIENRSGKPQKVFPNRSHIIWSSESKNLAAYILMLFHPATYWDYPKRFLYASFAKVRHIDAVRRCNLIIDGDNQLLHATNEDEHFNMNTLADQLRSSN